MANLIVPNNIEDTTVLKRFLTQLVTGLGSNPFYTGNVEQQNQAIIELLQNNPTLDFFNTVSQINELRSNILTYVEDNVETIVKQNTKDIALIAEQFGTFSEQALAASWYGLSVKAGGAVAGLEVGSLDPDITTPGDESSYFRIIADNFILGRAYEDLTQEEKNYLAANNLPNFGTVYNASKQPIPAMVTTWDSTEGVYKHYFNGIVQFSNIANADYAGAINNGATLINGGQISTVGLIAENISADEIVGKTITGAVINGAVINGAVVKASYLDLDGELEVLTNYHITPAMYNLNPGLYTDAIYLATADEYRIPSINTVRESYLNATLTTITSASGSIYSYNTANVGTNNKAVKIRPYFTNTTPFLMLTSVSTGNHSYLTNYLFSNHFRLSLGNIVLFEVKVEYSSMPGQYDGNLHYCNITYSGTYFATTVDFLNKYWTNGQDATINHSFNIGIGTLNVTLTSPYDYNTITLNCTLQSGTMQVPSDWISGSLKFEQLIVPIDGSSNFHLNSGLYINNII